jgi:hypothetical protein
MLGKKSWERLEGRNRAMYYMNFFIYFLPNIKEKVTGSECSMTVITLSGFRNDSIHEMPKRWIIDQFSYIEKVVQLQ